MSSKPYEDLSCTAGALPECGGVPCLQHRQGCTGADNAWNCVHNIGVCLEAVRRDRKLAEAVKQYIRAKEIYGKDPGGLGKAFQKLLEVSWELDQNLDI
jgi:hypothetical protein